MRNLRQQGDQELIQMLQKTCNFTKVDYITFAIQRISLAVVTENFTPTKSQNITLAFYNLILSSFESYGFKQRKRA